MKYGDSINREDLVKIVFRNSNYTSFCNPYLYSISQRQIIEHTIFHWARQHQIRVDITLDDPDSMNTLLTAYADYFKYTAASWIYFWTMIHLTNIGQKNLVLLMLVLLLVVMFIPLVYIMWKES